MRATSRTAGALAAGLLTVVLAGCGSATADADAMSSDASTTTSTSTGAAVTDLVGEVTAGADAGGGPGGSPFTAIVTCLADQGLDVDEADIGIGGPGGAAPGAPDGVPPGGGSMPDGTPPGDGSMPGPGAGPGGGDPTVMLAAMLGLDTADPDVAAALEACADEMTAPSD